MPPELENFIGSQVAAGAFQSADELLAESVAMLKAQKEADDAAIQKGIADYEAGRFQTLEELTDELTRRFKA